MDRNSVHMQTKGGLDADGNSVHMDWLREKLKDRTRKEKVGKRIKKKKKQNDRNTCVSAKRE